MSASNAIFLAMLTNAHAISPCEHGLNTTRRVFSNGLGGVHNYRIPAVVLTTQHDLVAFAEARHGGDDTASHIAARTSSDGGITWSPVVFAAGHKDTPEAREACKQSRTLCRAGNPAVTFDAIANEIVLVYVLRGYGHGEDAVGNAMVRSADGGRTWTQPLDLTAAFGPAAGCMPGPGTALQLTSGAHRGRLLVPCHQSAYRRDFVLLSDNNGIAWRAANASLEGMDEAAVTQLPNGSVLINMRSLSGSRLGRAVAISSDDGSTFGPITHDERLVSPVCQASLVSFGGATYFSNPSSHFSRSRLTIRRSSDSTATWSRELLVQSATSWGYSCLVKGAIPRHAGSFGDADGGILFEAPDGGIDFAKFPLDLGY